MLACNLNLIVFGMVTNNVTAFIEIFWDTNSTKKNHPEHNIRMY